MRPDLYPQGLEERDVLLVCLAAMWWINVPCFDPENLQSFIFTPLEPGHKLLRSATYNDGLAAISTAGQDMDL
jgi:hypothetical protein